MMIELCVFVVSTKLICIPRMNILFTGYRVFFKSRKFSIPIIINENSILINLEMLTQLKAIYKDVSYL